MHFAVTFNEVHEKTLLSSVRQFLSLTVFSFHGKLDFKRSEE